MATNQYPDGLPKELQSEYDKYLKDPKRYAKLHPVCFRILTKYIGNSHGKKEDKRRATK